MISQEKEKFLFSKEKKLVNEKCKKMKIQITTISNKQGGREDIYLQKFGEGEKKKKKWTEAIHIHKHVSLSLTSP